MERKRGVTVHWGILLVVYLAVLFATSMVALTSQVPNGPFLLLLAAGIPIYIVASCTIMNDEPRAHPRLEIVPQPEPEPKVVAFPDRAGAEATAEVVQAAGARTPRIRKLR